jgi:hypothetical protein
MRRVAAAVAVVMLGGCGSGEGPVDITSADPEGSAGELCRTLVDGLPDTMFDEPRRTAEPDPETTAAWGDPAVTLRCGVPRPEVLEPDSELMVISDVAWLAQPPEAPSLYTAVGRDVYVEMEIPPSYGAPAAALLPVSAEIDDQIPELPAGEF